MYYDVKKLKAEIKKLQIPGKYYRINLDELWTNDIYMMISVRENAAKTTQTLITGLCCYKLWKGTLEYIRSDTAQIRQKGIENLYNTVKKLHYIDKIFEGEWNDIEYKPRSRRFYLCRKDEDGLIEKIDTEPCCVCHSNEESEDLKSAYNNPNSMILFYDEFMDTKRATMNQWSEFMTNISTIARPENRVDDNGLPICKVIMAGNNTNQYSSWFDDFCISDEIANLKFGQYFKVKTELGTTMIVYMLDQSEDLKNKVEKGLIHFFGFKTKKAAQFIGITEWSGKTYKHLNFSIRNLRPLYNRIYIRHRNRYIQLELYKDKAYFVFCHFSGAPRKDDSYILCLDPEDMHEVYGIGKFENNARIYDAIKKLWRLKMENRWYYASNYVGELVSDYEKNIEF